MRGTGPYTSVGAQSFYIYYQTGIVSQMRVERVASHAAGLQRQTDMLALGYYAAHLYTYDRIVYEPEIGNLQPVEQGHIYVPPHTYEGDNMPNPDDAGYNDG